MNRAISFKTQLFFYLPMAHPRLYHLFNYRRNAFIFVYLRLIRTNPPM